MKNTIFLLLLVALSTLASAQPAGYYNGTEGKDGEQLKAALHEIIKGHIDFSYSEAKYVINYSDADMTNPDNVILFYTQRSESNENYGMDGDYINREHVWAKSHGDFSGRRPTDGDAHNLRPTDASVNQDRSNKDFDNCQNNGGTEHSEAAGCWFTADAWEPADVMKGDVARIIFYMSVRYEGTDGEIDLEAVNGLNTSPNPEHGNLAALLEWNELDPPSAFERRRNERVFHAQGNRNPFIDNPEFANLIWGGETANPVQIGSLSLNPQIPQAGQSVELSAEILAVGKDVGSATLYWGTSFDSEANSAQMNASGDTYSATIPAFAEYDSVFYKVVATAGTETNTLRGHYRVPRNFSQGDLTSISDIQGTGASSTMVGQTVNTSGIVVANFDASYYIQSGNETLSGMCVYGSQLRGRVGDSIVITGKVAEYESLTELVDVSYMFTAPAQGSIIPMELSVSEIGEEHEGMLVKINNVTFAQGGNQISDGNESYNFTDATGTMAMYCRHDSRLAGEMIPTGTVNVVGVVSQYGSAYQILVRSVNDFSEGTDTQAPSIDNASLIDGEHLAVYFTEAVEEASAETIGNYSINNGITVGDAYRHSIETNKVVLTIYDLTAGTHTLTVENVKDISDNAMSSDQVQFTSSTSSIEQVGISEALVYPNPAKRNCFVALHSTNRQNLVIYLFDAQGRKVLEKEAQVQTGENLIELNLSQLNKGVYSLRLQTGGAQWVKQIVVK